MPSIPSITYDVTIKIEHLLQHRDLLPVLKRTGCLFVTSAVESIDDAVLEKLAKGHTRADFVEAVGIMREVGADAGADVRDLHAVDHVGRLSRIAARLVDLELVENVGPIQLAMRLLIPAGSRLLELPEIREVIGPFDPAALSYPWQHSDPALDRLCAEIQKLIQREERRRASRSEIFSKIWELAHGRPHRFPSGIPRDHSLSQRTLVLLSGTNWKSRLLLCK